MRLLTPNEQREVEQLRAEISKITEYQYEPLEIYISFTDRELWLNILDMVLQTQDAMLRAWQKSDNPIINLRG